MKKIMIKSIALCIALFSLSACGDDEDQVPLGPCGHPYVDFVREAYPVNPIVEFVGQEFSNGTIYVKYITSEAGPRVQFIVGGTVSNICTKEHLQVYFSYKLSAFEQTIPLKIFGRVFWDPFYGDEQIILADGLLSSNDHPASTRLEIGLKQVFPDVVGTVYLYNTIEFESQGGLDQDIVYFQNHIAKFDLYTNYALFE